MYRYLVTHTPSRPVAVQGGPGAPGGGLWSFPGRFSFHGLDTMAFFLGLEGLLGGLSSQDAAFQELIIHSLVYLPTEGETPFILIFLLLLSILTCLPFLLLSSSLHNMPHRTPEYAASPAV